VLSLSPVFSGGPAMFQILFRQLSGHMHAVIELSAGDFVRRALLCGLSGNFGFCAVQCGSWR